MGAPIEKPEFRQPSPSELEHSASVLRLLADRTRLGIVTLLAPGDELAVGDIAERLNRAVPSVSQHLAKLRHGKLVNSRRDGTTILYRLEGEHVAMLVENLLQHTEHELFADPPHHRAAGAGEVAAPRADASGTATLARETA